MNGCEGRMHRGRAMKSDKWTGINRRIVTYTDI